MVLMHIKDFEIKLKQTSFLTAFTFTRKSQNVTCYNILCLPEIGRNIVGTSLSSKTYSNVIGGRSNTILLFANYVWEEMDRKPNTHKTQDTNVVAVNMFQLCRLTKGNKPSFNLAFYLFSLVIYTGCGHKHQP